MSSYWHNETLHPRPLPGVPVEGVSFFSLIAGSIAVPNFLALHDPHDIAPSALRLNTTRGKLFVSIKQGDGRSGPSRAGLSRRDLVVGNFVIELGRRESFLGSAL